MVAAVRPKLGTITSGNVQVINKLKRSPCSFICAPQQKASDGLVCSTQPQTQIMIVIQFRASFVVPIVGKSRKNQQLGLRNQHQHLPLPPH